MYIVTRTFRDSNGVFSVGSIVEPTEVKTFKSRLQQRHIVDVNEQNISKWALFFKNRYNIDLATVLQDYLKRNSSTAAAKPKESVVQKRTIKSSDW